MKRFLAIVALLGIGVLSARLSSAQAGPQEGGVRSDSGVHFVGTLLIQLRVADLDRSVAFYRDTLGLELELRNDELKWVRMKTGIKGVTIGLGESPTPGGSGTASMNLGVIDVDAARALLESKGVKFQGETIIVPNVVKLADLTDPDGNRIRLAQDIKNKQSP